MEKVDSPLQFPEKDLRDPLERLSGAVRRTYGDMEAAADSFSNRRFK